MTVAIGPIETLEVGFLPIKAIPDFMAGLLHGLVIDYDLEELQSCMKGSKKVANDAQKVLHDVFHHQVIHAAMEFHHLTEDFS